MATEIHFNNTLHSYVLLTESKAEKHIDENVN